MGRKKKRFTRPTIPEIQAFKEFLGPLASAYSESRLIRLRKEMHEMAGLLLDIYLSRRSDSDHEEE
jgi:hypothetical protein